MSNISDKISRIKNLSFEQAFKELENLLTKIEESESSLDNLVENYEYGMELKKFLQKKLSEAELKISKINENK